MITIRLLFVRSALQYCANVKQKRFDRHRLTMGTEWVQEYRRFAFSSIEL